MKNFSQTINKIFLFLLIIIFSAAPTYSATPTTAKPEPQSRQKPLIQAVEGGELGISGDFSFKFDKTGKPAAAYYDLDTRDLKFATVEKAQWQISTVAPAGINPAGLQCSLDFNPKNEPCIAFFSREKNLKLAVRSGDAWNVETVDDTENSGLFASLITLPDGEAAISYQSPKGTMYARKLMQHWIIGKIDRPGEKTQIHKKIDGNISVYYIGTNEKNKTNIIKIANKNNEKWEIINIPGSEQNLDFSVSFDEKGTPCIAYIDKEYIKLYRETVAKSGIWKEHTVRQESASSISTVVQKEGFPALCYITGDKSELKIARFDGAEWQIKKVATAKEGNRLRNCFITAGKNGREIILLHDGATLNALVESKDGWNLGRIDGKIQTGGFIKAILQKNGAPFLCYYDYTRNELHFAKKDKQGLWNIQVVDSAGDVGKFPSLSIDPAEKPAIAYFDQSRQDLKYAWKSDDFWRWERVDHKGDVGYYPSLCFDSGGAPHISYISKSDASIKYATRTGKTWSVETVGPLGDYGGESFIFVDSEKKPTIIYTDGKKMEKPTAGESPVQTYIKIAKKNGEGKWEKEFLIKPYGPALVDNGLSGDAANDGTVAISFIDRDSRLRLLRFFKGEWKDDIGAKLCHTATSVKINSDGKIGILYLAGESKYDSHLHFTTFDGKKWKDSIPKIGQKIKFISLAAFDGDNLQFAFGDSINYLAWYFFR